MHALKENAKEPRQKRHQKGMSTGLNCLVLFFDSTDKNRLKLKKRMGKKETPPHTRAHTRIRTERERESERDRERDSDFFIWSNIANIPSRKLSSKLFLIFAR